MNVNKFPCLVYRPPDICPVAAKQGTESIILFPFGGLTRGSELNLEWALFWSICYSLSTAQINCNFVFQFQFHGFLIILISCLFTLEQFIPNTFHCSIYTELCWQFKLFLLCYYWTLFWNLETMLLVDQSIFYFTIEISLKWISFFLGVNGNVINKSHMIDIFI